MCHSDGMAGTATAAAGKQRGTVGVDGRYGGGGGGREENPMELTLRKHMEAGNGDARDVGGLGINGTVRLVPSSEENDDKDGGAKKRKTTPVPFQLPKGLGTSSVTNVPVTLLDETERKIRRPKVDADDIYRLLVEHYDLGEIRRDSMRELASYDDKNWYFKARTTDPKTGRPAEIEYVVKVHNGKDSSGVSRSVLAAQERVMMFLQDQGIVCSRVVRSKLAMYTTPGPNGTVQLVPAGTKGAKLEYCMRVTFLARNQVAHTMRVLTFVRGKLLVQVPMPHPEEFVYRSGVFVGRICEALSKWPLPHQLEIQKARAGDVDAASASYIEQHALCWQVLASRSRLWDLRFFMDVQHFMTDLIMRGLFKDETRIMMCNTVFNAFKHLVQPVSEALRVGVLHNDLNEQNIIALESVDPVVSPQDAEFGVIDFGDVVVSWRVNEIAIAMAYCCLEKKYPVRDMSVMLAGIQSVYPLTPLEMRILPCLISARLVTSLVMGMYSYHMQIIGDGEDTQGDGANAPPGNEYVLTTQKTGWFALTRLLTVGAEVIFKRFIADSYAEDYSKLPGRDM